MFGGKARQYPNLATYLHHVTRKPAPTMGRLPLSAAIGLTSVWGVFTAGATLLQQPGLAIPAAMLTFGLGALLAKGQKQEPTAKERRQDEAREVGLRMQRCLELRRLHRDLDENSMLILEECANHWSRVYGVFGSGFWNDPDLPATYASARRQALNAADEGMEDVLLLYGPMLPSEVGGRQAMDYVEEALETYVFRGQVPASHPPAAFHQAHQIALKLGDLADEAERIANDLHRERLSATTPTSTSLDASLGELRAIRHAEDELRQNLRG